MMKKKVMWIIFIVVAIPLIWYKIPVYKHRTLEGVLFQLGAENAHYAQTVEVEFKGVMKRYFFKPRTFEGTIRIDDQLFPPPDSPDEKLKVYFSRGQLTAGLIQYRTDPDNILITDMYGMVEFNFDLSKVVIMIFDKEGGGFNYANGKMIVAPASNRAEALKIADRLVNYGFKPLE